MAPIQLKRKTEEERAAVEREVLFELDGIEYEVDTEFTAAFALEYIAKSAERGLDAANIWLMQMALREGYIVLREFQDLEPEDLGGILDNLISKVHKAMEPGKKSPKKS